MHISSPRPRGPMMLAYGSSVTDSDEVLSVDEYHRGMATSLNQVHGVTCTMSEPTTIQIAGRNFVRVDFDVPAEGRIIRYRSYTEFGETFVLKFALIARDTNQLAEVEAILNTLSPVAER